MVRMKNFAKGRIPFRSDLVENGVYNVNRIVKPESSVNITSKTTNVKKCK